MTMTGEQFEEAVQSIMRRDYAIEAEKPIEGAPGQSPEQWVARYVSKYDLMHRDEMTLEKAVELFRELGIDPPFQSKPR
jgi:hypothetical protein